MLDVTGCAQLFGGEAGLVGAGRGRGGRLRLHASGSASPTRSARPGRWRATPAPRAGPAHAGDAIDQEARATRSRAQKRRWERGGAAAAAARTRGGPAGIVPPGATLARIGAAAGGGAAARARGRWSGCRRSASRRIADLAALPRAAIARRFGPEVVRRLDQALGRAPEPVSPAPPAPVFALRLSFPEPIGRSEDVLAGIDRLLPPLAARLRDAGKGARRVRLTLVRTDGSAVVREVGLARPADRPAAIRRCSRSGSTGSTPASASR